MSKQSALSRNPAEALTQALEDLALCEADPLLKIRMGAWFLGANDGEPACSVCLAGAVMVQRLDRQADLQEMYEVEEYEGISEGINPAAVLGGSSADGCMMFALNYLRRGLTTYALEGLDLHLLDKDALYADLNALENAYEGRATTLGCGDVHTLRAEWVELMHELAKDLGAVLTKHDWKPKEYES